MSPLDLVCDEGQDDIDRLLDMTWKDDLFFVAMAPIGFVYCAMLLVWWHVVQPYQFWRGMRRQK